MKFRFIPDNRVVIYVPEDMAKELDNGYAVIFIRSGCYNSMILTNDLWEKED